MQKTLFLLIMGITFGQLGLTQSIAPVTTLRINPDYIRGGNVSEIFDSVTYIPLETTKESTFGNIDKLPVSQHYFAFFDYSTKGIFVFDKTGKFVGKITKAPELNKNNNWTLINFILNPYTEEIYLPYNNWDGSKMKVENSIAIFKPSGELQQVLKLDTTVFKSIIASSFAFIDSTTTLFARDMRDTTNKTYFVTIKDFKQVLKNLDSISDKDSFYGDSRHYTNSTTGNQYSIWSRSFDYTKKIIEHGKLETYRFLLPAKLSLDPSFYKDISLMSDGNRIMEFNHIHKDLVSRINQTFKSGELFFFTFIKGNQSSVYDSYFFNSTSQNLYNFSKINPDSTNGYLPIISVTPGAADDHYLYSKIPSFLLFQSKEANASKHPAYSAVMQQYFAHQDRKSNPVIVVLKPKKNL